MQPSQTFIAAIAAFGLACRVQAFELYFYADTQCNGELLAQLEISNLDVCTSEYLEESESVLVQMQSSDPQEADIAFFSTNDCGNPASPLIELPTGCVDTFGLGVESYMIQAP